MDLPLSNSEGLRKALECVFVLVSLGNANTLESLQTIKKKIGSTCESLFDLFESLQAFLLSGSCVALDLDIYRVSRRRFKAQFKQAAKVLPETPFLNKCSIGQVILSCISAILAKLGEINNIRTGKP